MTIDELRKRLKQISPLMFIVYKDFQPTRIFFKEMNENYLICDFISNQIDVTNCFKYLEIDKIDDLKKLITKYVNDRDKEEDDNEH